MTDVKIEQRHREAAAALEPDGRERDQILRGKRNGSAIVRAFAKFEADRLAHLTREKSEHLAAELEWGKVSEQLQARAIAAESALAGAIDVMKPFAEMGKLLDGPFSAALFKDDEPVRDVGDWSENGEPRTITFGHFRALTTFIADREAV